MGFNIASIRNDFPSLQETFNRKPIIYFDNACVTLRPRKTIEAIKEYYTEYPGCHGRTLHKFGKKTTERYNQARKKVKEFISAKDASEIIFVRNTTEAINLIANTLNFKEGDIVLTSELEHNSNFLPWQVLSRKGKIAHQLIPLNKDLTFNLEEFKKKLNQKVRLVSLFHTSNITGYTLPASEIIKTAHEYGSLVLLDGAQSIAHQKINVQELDADFFAFSFHKMLGPSGIGVCYGKQALLKEMPQFLIGGETVIDAYLDHFIPAQLPEKFEAGLQNYAGAIGAEAAIKYLEELGEFNIKKQEYALNKLLTEELLKLPGINILGPANPELRGNIVNFISEDIDSLVLARLLDETKNIMVRAGMHCAHPWFNAQGLPPSVRISVYFYNTEEEIAIFIKTLGEIIKYFH
jgi:cysteine desulfurase/selenocysteine lyase